jgi:hypothetical protein
MKKKELTKKQEKFVDLMVYHDYNQTQCANLAYGPAVAAEVARAKLAGLMVDKKEYKIHKIDSMSREQLELRLNELMLDNQLTIEAKLKEEKD